MAVKIAGTSGAVLYSDSGAEGVSSTGSADWTVTPLAEMTPTTDSAGVSYDIEQVNVGEPTGTPGRSDVVARQGGTVLWDVTPDPGYVLYAVAVGNDRVYVTGVIENESVDTLFTLDASTGAILNRTTIPDVSVETLSAYNGGVVTEAHNGETGDVMVRYFGADGSTGSSYTAPAGYFTNDRTGEPLVDANGTVYLYDSSAYICAQPTAVTVVIVRPSSGVSSPVTLDGSCDNGSFQATVTPRGLAVITGNEAISVVHPDGTLTAAQALPSTPGEAYGVLDMHANTNGDVMVARSFETQCYQSGSIPTCPGLQFDLIDPASGSVVTPAVLLVPQSSGDYYDMYSLPGMAFDSTWLYVSLIVPGSTSAGTPSLMAFDTADLGLEYPEALLSGAGGTSTPSPTPSPSSSAGQVLLGLGDSVAAGHGLGPSSGFPDNANAYPMLVASQLGYSGNDYAISGACAGTPHKDSASVLTPSTCTTSVLNNELPAASGVKPSVITLTVGANDIQFGQCLQAVVLGNGTDPCQGATFTNNLLALSQNLKLLFSQLRKNYPGVPIYAMQYYNPLPQAPISTQDICPAFRAIAAYATQNKSAYITALLKGLAGQYDKAAAKVQANIYNTAENVLSKLNKIILTASTASGVKTVPLYFGGHDFCETLTGGSVADTWVYGPSLDGTVSGYVGLASKTISFNFDLPEACPVPDAGDSTAYYASGSGSSVAGSWSYSFTGKVNCLPHPTIEGQRAIASAFMGHISP